MPTSNEHAIRVRDALRFIGDVPPDCPTQTVTERFYACLHMLEAAVFDFKDLSRQRHYTNHSERGAFLKSIAYDFGHPLFEVIRDYEALKALSESARYCSPKGSSVYTPLRPQRDLPHAAELHRNVQQTLERIYTDKRLRAPWLGSDPQAEPARPASA